MNYWSSGVGDDPLMSDRDFAGPAIDDNGAGKLFVECDLVAS
jgi:hypothetical protein